MHRSDRLFDTSPGRCLLADYMPLIALQTSSCACYAASTTSLRAETFGQEVGMRELKRLRMRVDQGLTGRYHMGCTGRPRMSRVAGVVAFITLSM